MYPNKQQCLAIFPYNTREVIRFTQCEAATKFLTMDELLSEFSNIPEASYAVIKDYKNNNLAFEIGLIPIKKHSHTYVIM